MTKGTRRVKRVKRSGRLLTSKKARAARIGPDEILGLSPFGSKIRNKPATTMLELRSWRRDTLLARLRKVNDEIHKIQATCLEDFISEEELLKILHCQIRQVKTLRVKGLPCVRVGSYTRLYIKQQVTAFISALAIH